MTLAGSFDPLYPLRAHFPVSRLVFELVELDIHQYLLCITGKVSTFSVLQARFEVVSPGGNVFFFVILTPR